MKRTNYLVATILAAIVLAGQLVLNAWTTLVYLRVFMGGPFPIDALYVLGIQGLIDAIILVAFILTLVGIKYTGKDKEKFRNGLALIITNIVFIFLVIAILVYMGVRSLSTADQTYTIINLGSAGILLAANILYIVALAKKEKTAAAPVETATEQPVAVEEPKVEVAPAKAEKKPVAKKATAAKKPAAKTTAKKPAAKTPTAKTPAKKTATAKKPAAAAKKPATTKKTTKK